MYSNCPEFTRQCEASCDWTSFPETIPDCPRSCGTPRCVCREGFVRVSNENDTCVPFNYCSSQASLYIILNARPHYVFKLNSLHKCCRSKQFRIQNCILRLKLNARVTLLGQSVV